MELMTGFKGSEKKYREYIKIRLLTARGSGV